MIVMVANNAGWDAGVLYGRYPQHVGHLYSPPSGRRPNFMPPYALDNGRYASFTSGKAWDEIGFLKLLDSHGAGARWVVVPDCVGDRDGTLREWDKWEPRLSVYQYPLVMAVQDGMTIEDVPTEADGIFLGGSTEWKRRTLYYWGRQQRRIRHCGRINTEKWLWRCLDAGFDSCDGTGWFRGDKAQFRGLERFLVRHSAGKGERQRGLFEASSESSNPTKKARGAALGSLQRQPDEENDGPDDHQAVGQGCSGAA